MEDRKNWDLSKAGGGGDCSRSLEIVIMGPGGVGYDNPPTHVQSPISAVQALKDIVSSTEQMLKDGEINLENYQKIVESAVQGIKEIGLKDGK